MVEIIFMNREICDQLSLLTVELLEEPGYLRVKKAFIGTAICFFKMKVNVMSFTYLII